MARKKQEQAFAFPKKQKRKISDAEANREKRRVESIHNRIRALPCTACFKTPPSDPDHLSTRGAGGENSEENLWPLCRKCHTERHKIGLTSFTAKYEQCQATLLLKGWYFCPLRKKWRLSNE